MKLLETIKKLFYRKPEPSIWELVEKHDNEKIIEHIGNRTFQTLYAVVSTDSFRTIRNGFETKSEAKDFSRSLSDNAYIFPYEIEI